MAKVITCSAFDANSIMNAYKELAAWRRQFNYRCKRFVQLIAKEGAEVAQQVYGEGQTWTEDDVKITSFTVQVEAVPTDSGYAIVANGEQVCFLEFGAGVYAGGNPLGKNMPFDVRAGSWSESAEGKHTWSKWLASGKAMQDYPYNQPHSPGMYMAWKAIMDKTREIAYKVFK